MGRIGRLGCIHTHTLPCVKYLASGNLLNNTGNYTWGSVMTQRSGTGGGRSKRESIYVYIYIADSLPYTSETNMAL